MLVFKGPLFYLIMIPKGKSSDAGNSDIPMRSHEVLIVNKEVKVSDCTREKKGYIVVANAKIYSKNETSIYETVKKEKKMCWFFCAIQSAQFVATELDEG